MPRAATVNPARSPTPVLADHFGDETDEKWEAYLDERRKGITPDLAARAIGLTGSRMRAFLNREPERRAAADEAAAEGVQHYQERLRATSRVLALDTSNPNPRVLEVELATHVPEYAHLRRDRVRHEGHITHGLTLDLSALDELPLEERRELLAVLERFAAVTGEVIDGEATELRALPSAAA